MGSKTTSKSTSLGVRNNRVLITIIAVTAILLTAFFAYVANKALQTEVYYELKEPVLAKQTITPDMTQEVVTKKGTAPTTAISQADLQSGKAQSKFPMGANEVLTYGNVGSADDNLHDSLLKRKEQDMAKLLKDGKTPKDYENWVLTSFSVGADNAVGGRITPGSYFDIMVITENGAFYPFINVRAIDTTVSLDGASSSSAADSSEAYAGQTSQYVVKLTPFEAARLQWFVNTFGNIKLVLNDKSDVKSDGSKQEASGEGANSYGGFNSETNGDYTGVEVVSANIKMDKQGQVNATDTEKLKTEASEAAKKAREERAARANKTQNTQNTQESEQSATNTSTEQPTQ